MQLKRPYQAIKRIFLLFSGFLILGLMACSHSGEGKDKEMALREVDLSRISNPFIPGYLADPSVLINNGVCYVYGTQEPWGGLELTVWESSDFLHWTLRGLNWPNRISCTSPTSIPSGITAPSVVQGKDGKFYMYVSAGGEIWAGVSDHPLGPWYNVFPDERPLITYQEKEETRNLDPECFIDDDGQAYLFWGGADVCKYSHCMGVKLDEDMHTFQGAPVKMILPEYTGGPFVFKKNSTYFMLYSERHCDYQRSKIRYAVADNPLGPWKEGSGSPIVRSDPEKGIFAPGHPAVLEKGDKTYLLFHANLPDSNYRILRQLYIFPLGVDSTTLQLEEQKTNNYSRNEPIKIQRASSQLSADYPASAVLDGNFGTLWVPAADDKQPTLVLDLGKEREINTVYIWFENGYRIYLNKVEYSSDGKEWEQFGDASKVGRRGSPQFHTNFVDARYLKLTIFPRWYRTGIWEIRIQ